MSVTPDKLLLHQTQLPPQRALDACRIEGLKVSAFRIPTTAPESDGTVEWKATTLVLVEIRVGQHTGVGYTYAESAAGVLIDETLRPLIEGQDAMNIAYLWARMVHEVRNLGVEGLCSMAISAVDNALWDLKAKLLDISLVRLLGQVRERVPVYGSGGFTSYSNSELQKQLGGWAASGIQRVKMKIGTHLAADRERVAAARQAVGPDVQLLVDANGAYHPQQALGVARMLAQYNVVWFEEPVDHHDVDGLRRVRDGSPAGMDVTAGEYGFVSGPYFQRLQSAVDILQADVTRCGGVTSFMRMAALCEVHLMPLSSHCAPSLHAHVGCAAPTLRHLEYFYDHVRIEQMLFDGVLPAVDGTLRPDSSRPGLGLAFKHADAARFAV